MTDLDRPVAPRRGALQPFGSLWGRGERLRQRAEPYLDRLRAAATTMGAGSAEPYSEVAGQVHSRLRRAAIIGFIGGVLITVGASQYQSPFTQHQPGSWFFGIPPMSSQTTPVGGLQPPPGSGLFLGLVAVYGGMLLLMRAWYDVVRTASRHRGIPLRYLASVFGLWVLPMLIVAPLFSRDLYSYVCQGQMMTIHANPYQFGCGNFGTGAGSLFAKVDPLWNNVTSPYGPVFLVLGGWIVDITHHNGLASLVGFRFLALLGTVMFAVAIPDIARSFGRDRATAFALAALNPLILLNLIGGGHNDALMVGFLAVGYALSRRGHPLLGIAACAIGTVVKVPAIVGVVYIGWEWLGHNVSTRERIRPTAIALGLAGVVIAAVTLVSGLGWGWISGLSNPDAIRSWLDPATGVGLLAGRIAQLFGVGGLSHSLLTVARGGAMLIACAIALRLLVRSEQIGPLVALGWTLFAFAVLGPVVQPWYLCWGFVFLAPVAEGMSRYVICILSAASSFLGLPGGVTLVEQIGVANPWLVAVTCTALVTLCASLVVPRVRRYRQDRRGALAMAGGAVAAATASGSASVRFHE